MNFVLVAIGGAVGSMLRYSCSRLWNGTGFPYGTLAVNIIGSFLIGVLWAVLTKQADDPKRLLLVTGFCGGFTTFSAFSFESLQMLQQSRITHLVLYTSVTLIAGLVATYIGLKLFHT